MALVTMYITKGGRTITTREGPNPVSAHGGDRTLVDTDDRVFGVKCRNLVACGYVVFTSPQCDHARMEKCTECANWSIDEVIRGLLGATFPAGLYEF